MTESVSARKILEDNEIRHISGRVVYAMEWVTMLREKPLLMTQEQRNSANMAIYASAADVIPLLGEVGLLRSLVNETAGYLIDVIKDEKSDPEARIIALTAISLLQIQMPDEEDGASGD